MFVVGIGSAPAEGVLRRLGEASGGACEFVAPQEDAEGAILRMFARMRAPRIASARIDWPSQPVWTTPVPTGLFGGETVHAFAGFDAAPAGDAALQLAPADDANAMSDRPHRGTRTGETLRASPRRAASIAPKRRTS